MEHIQLETLNALCDRLAQEAGRNYTNATTTESPNTSVSSVLTSGDNGTYNANATSTVATWIQDIDATTTR